MSEPQTTPITINLNPIAMELLRDSQKKYEQLFNTRISYEEILIKALFSTNNTNTIKLAMVNTYEESTPSIANDLSNEVIINKMTSKARNTNRKKRKIPFKQQETNQVSLGGF